MHEGHRRRLTDRLSGEGIEAAPDHEILEYLLFHVIPRADTNALAHRLVDAFGSLCGVLEARQADLMLIEGIGRRAAAYLSSFPGLFRAYERSKLGKRPSVKAVKDACELARSLLFGKPYEQLCVIWLDAQSRAILCERLFEGGLQESAVYIEKLAAAALRSRAVKCIIAHNHPGGGVTPSAADTVVTRDIQYALGTLGIELIDHIIIGGNASLSFQADSLMEKRGLPREEAYAAQYGCIKRPLIP